jgi:hypothetical protein
MSDMGDTIYPDLASAQAALDRGETVRIEMQPFVIDPALVQLAQDLQDQERLQQFQADQTYKETHREEYHQFLDDTVGDEEYNAYLEHLYTPRAEDY